jgi:hypothetical protein
MNKKHRIVVASLAGSLALALVACAGMKSDADKPGFFVTSVGGGKGADFGGLAGADQHCQKLAGAAGLAGTWHAYLSASATTSAKAVDARDRIGSGPWKNVKGVTIADSVADLHANNRITKETALTENGAVVNGVGDTPNMHDVLTGSQTDGTAFGGSDDRTCGNWTKGGDGAAMVGHSDRTGLRDDPPAHSWNSSHPSRGCSDPQLAASGGAGKLYCFAVR